MFKLIIKILIKIFVIAIILFMIVLFNFPNLLSPKNLGVKVSKELYNVVLNKLHCQVSDIPSNIRYDDYTHIYGEPVKVNDSFTSEEITSFMKYTQKAYYAIKNVQLLISDSSVSVSATINVNKVLGSIDGIPIQYRKKENLPVSFIIPDNVNIYIKFSGTIKNNIVENFDIMEFEVAGNDVMMYVKQNYGISIILDEINDQLNYLKDTMGIYVTEAIFSDDQLLLNGDFPSSYSVEKK